MNVSSGIVSTLVGTFFSPHGIAVTSGGAIALVVSRFASASRFYELAPPPLQVANHAINRISIASGEVSAIAGLTGVPGFNDNSKSNGTFNRPWGIAMDPSGSFALVVSLVPSIRSS